MVKESENEKRIRELLEVMNNDRKNQQDAIEQLVQRINQLEQNPVSSPNQNPAKPVETVDPPKVDSSKPVGKPDWTTGSDTTDEA